MTHVSYATTNVKAETTAHCLLESLVQAQTTDAWKSASLTKRKHESAACAGRGKGVGGEGGDKGESIKREAAEGRECFSKRGG